MKPYMLFLLFFIVLALWPYLSRFHRRNSRPGIRRVTIYGVVFCVVGLNLWFVTRFEDVLAGFPSQHQVGIFATPWPWILAVCVGVALLVISFFTRKSRPNVSAN
jgi:hypothetical protein